MTKFMKCKDNYKPTVIYSHDGIEYKKLPWKWRRKYKYELVKDYTIYVSGIEVRGDIFTKYIVLKRVAGGILMTLKKAYQWDGPSGITFDRKTNMRGGLVHDGGYQCLREGLVNFKYVDVFDKLFEKILIKDGMWKWLARRYFQAVNNDIVHNACARPR